MILTATISPDGIDFSIECYEGLEIKKGDVVTFAYDQYSTQTIPLNPSILRVRKDISWEDVMHEHERDNASNADDAKGILFSQIPFLSS